MGFFLLASLVCLNNGQGNNARKKPINNRVAKVVGAKAVVEKPKKHRFKMLWALLQRGGKDSPVFAAMVLLRALSDILNAQTLLKDPEMFAQIMYAECLLFCASGSSAEDAAHRIEGEKRMKVLRAKVSEEVMKIVERAFARFKMVEKAALGADEKPLMEELKGMNLSEGNNLGNRAVRRGGKKAN